MRQTIAFYSYGRIVDRQGGRMKQLMLPGLKVNQIDVFKLEVGTAVYDRASKRTGKITSIRETKNEVVEAFITLDEDKEVKAYMLSECVIL